MSDIETPKTKSESVGIRIEHTGEQKSGLLLVPVISKPFPIPSNGTENNLCPTCQVWHPCKTIHLNLEGDGTCIVSEGVLDYLKLAGLEEFDLQVVGEVRNPPPLKIGGKAPQSRAEQDQANRMIVVHTL